MERWKRVASHRIKKACDIREVWERESFDHMLRSDESMRQKSEYVCQNPVRAGFVRHPDEWRWLWRSWVEGAREEAARCAPPWPLRGAGTTQKTKQHKKKKKPYK